MLGCDDAEGIAAAEGKASLVHRVIIAAIERAAEVTDCIEVFDRLAVSVECLSVLVDVDITGEQLVTHHIKKYGGAFPLWVIMELFSFGALNTFYSDMKVEDKRAIAESAFDLPYRCVENWLNCLSELRLPLMATEDVSQSQRRRLISTRSQRANRWSPTETEKSDGVTMREITGSHKDFFRFGKSTEENLNGKREPAAGRQCAA